MRRTLTIWIGRTPGLPGMAPRRGENHLGLALAPVDTVLWRSRSSSALSTALPGGNDRVDAQSSASAREPLPQPYMGTLRVPGGLRPTSPRFSRIAVHVFCRAEPPSRVGYGRPLPARSPPIVQSARAAQAARPEHLLRPWRPRATRQRNCRRRRPRKALVIPWPETQGQPPMGADRVRTADKTHRSPLLRAHLVRLRQPLSILAMRASCLPRGHHTAMLAHAFPRVHCVSCEIVPSHSSMPPG